MHPPKIYLFNKVSIKAYKYSHSHKCCDRKVNKIKNLLENWTELPQTWVCPWRRHLWHSRIQGISSGVPYRVATVHRCVYPCLILTPRPLVPTDRCFWCTPVDQHWSEYNFTHTHTHPTHTTPSLYCLTYLRTRQRASCQRQQCRVHKTQRGKWVTETVT